jgi:uncharacterized membrane protein YfcA
MLLLQRRIADTLVGRQGRRSWLLRAGMFATGVYGGYFGAAVSVLVLALLAVTIDETLPRLNALKVPLAGAMNLASGLLFAFLAPVHWGYVLVLAPSTLAGGRLGASFARHIPVQTLRVVVVVLGVGAAAWLQFSQ